MKYLINICAMFGLVFFITSCATDVMKAPCDNQGHFCGRKTKINHW